jgi:hypothetical protein
MAGQDHVLSKAFLAAVSGFSNAIILGQLVVVSAGTTLDPNQCSLVGTGGGAALQPTPLGLTAENLDLVKIQTGKAYVTVNLAGIAFGIADGAIAVGAAVIPSATTAGRLITSTVGTTGRPSPGVAVTAATAAGDIFSVLLTPGARV